MTNTKHSSEATINASIEEVSEMLSDVEKLGKCMELITNVEILSDIKRGIGTQSRWTLDMGDGNPKTWVEEVDVFDPPNNFGFKTISGGHKMIGRNELKKIDENKTWIRFSTELLYMHSDPARHEETMDNQLASMKKCLEK